MSEFFLTGEDIENVLLQNAVKKAKASFDMTIFAGIIAGFWVSLGALAGISIAGGIPPEVRQAWPFLPRLAIGMVFPLALHWIVLFCGSLFTGNCMLMGLALFRRKVTAAQVLRDWSIVWLANLAGCLLTCYFFGYLTKLFAAPTYVSYVQELAMNKALKSNFGEMFLKAIPANTLVCMSVFLGAACKDSAGKFFFLWHAPLMFVICNFDHSIASMAFISIGMMYGAPVSIGRFLYYQLSVSLGNIVGGMFVMAGSHALMNHYGGITSVVHERRRHQQQSASAKMEMQTSALRHHEDRVAV